MDPKSILEALRCIKTVTAGATSLIAGMCEEVGLVDIIEWIDSREFFCEPDARKAAELFIGSGKRDFTSYLTRS